MNTLRRLLIALMVILGLSTVSWADDIDIYTDAGASSGLPNVLFVIDTGANFSSNAAVPCTSYASSPGEAPSLGGTAGGIEQCALVDAISAVPVNSDGSATINLGLLVNNNNNCATDSRSASDPAYHGFLRVAHMGHVNAHMTLGALAVIEAGMVSLGIPHGAGALAAAARVVGAAA